MGLFEAGKVSFWSSIVDIPGGNCCINWVTPNEIKFGARMFA